MMSTNIKSDFIEIKNELLSEKLGENSINAYVLTNNLWAYHHIGKNVNSGPQQVEMPSLVRIAPQSEPSMAPIVISRNENLEEGKIRIQSESNFELVAEPKGPFTDRAIRNGFIRKVYGILSLQLTITVIGTVVMMYFFKDDLNIKKMKENYEKNNEKDKEKAAIILIVLISATVAFISVFCSLACIKCCRRTVPLNFILLAIFTGSGTIIVGFACCQHNGDNVLLAFIITAVITISITLLAMSPCFDITNCGLLLCIFLLIHTVMGVIIFVVMLSTKADKEEMRPWYMAMAIAGAFIFTLYLLYDTQQILGGKKVEMNPEEYILGVICLYVDIFQIFLNVLSILNGGTD